MLKVFSMNLKNFLWYLCRLREHESVGVQFLFFLKSFIEGHIISRLCSFAKSALWMFRYKFLQLCLKCTQHTVDYYHPDCSSIPVRHFVIKWGNALRVLAEIDYNKVNFFAVWNVCLEIFKLLCRTKPKISTFLMDIHELFYTLSCVRKK